MVELVFLMIALWLVVVVFFWFVWCSVLYTGLLLCEFDLNFALWMIDGVFLCCLSFLICPGLMFSLCYLVMLLDSLVFILASIVWFWFGGWIFVIVGYSVYLIVLFIRFTYFFGGCGLFCELVSCDCLIVLIVFFYIFDWLFWCN